MSDDFDSQREALSSNSEADISGIKDRFREERNKASLYTDKSQKEQELRNIDKREREEIDANKRITAAGQGVISRQEKGRITGSNYAVQTTNLTGVDDYAAGMSAIEGAYNTAYDKTDSGAERIRLGNEFTANKNLFQRQTNQQNAQLFRQNGVAAQGNYAAQLGLQGNTIGSSLANIQQGRLQAEAEYQNNMVGVNAATNPFKAQALQQQRTVAMAGFGLQEQQARKNYGLTLNSMDANNTSSQQLLGHDFLGAATTQINAQRANAKATMPSGQFTRANVGFNIQQRQAQVNEEDRSLMVGLDISRIDTNANAIHMAAGGKAMHAQIESIRGNSEANIKSVQAENITDKEKNAKIDVYKKEASAKIEEVQREIRHRQYGGTAVSLGNFVNFAQDSTRDRDPQEDLANAAKTGRKVDAGFVGTQNATKAAVAKRTAANNALGVANNAAMAAVPDQDKKDAAEGNKVVDLLQKILNILPQVLAAQP
jgi:nucleoid DNA-binding protein